MRVWRSTRVYSHWWRDGYYLGLKFGNGFDLAIEQLTAFNARLGTFALAPLLTRSFCNGFTGPRQYLVGTYRVDGSLVWSCTGIGNGFFVGSSRGCCVFTILTLISLRFRC